MTRRGLMATGAAASVPLLLAGCGDDSPSGAGTTAGEKPKRGGRLRTAHVGAGQDETLDPGLGPNLIDLTRYLQLFEGLAKHGADGSGPELVLAEAIEPKVADGSVWTVKLQRGVEFHDGKPMTADDVIYSLRRPFDTEAGQPGSALAANLDPKNGFKKINDHEIELHLKTPAGDLPSIMTGRDCLVFPDGFDDFKNPIGTGPFTFVSFTPGQRSLFKRNDNYWGTGGGPYVDELEQISIDDGTARANALVSGEVDVVEAFDFDQARAFKDNPAVVLLEAKNTSSYSYAMRMDMKPFTDPNVRLAMKLAIDRQPAIDLAYAGFGHLGNDMWGKGLAGYPDDVEQHEYDPERAKSLLAKAGYADGLDVAIRHDYAPDTGGVKGATVFAEQAKAAGINITSPKYPPGTDVNVGPRFPSFMTLWGGDIMGIGVWMLSDSVYQEGWYRPDWDKLYKEAAATTDKARRIELMEEMNRIWHADGIHLIWGFFNQVDGLAPNVRGAYPAVAGYPLSNFDFKSYWLA